MLNIETLPLLLKIISKIDITPIIETLKGVDIFEEVKDVEGVKKQLSREKAGVVAMAILADITPQLGKIADDLPAVVAAYKGVSIEDANKLDLAEVVNEIYNDNGIFTFFKRALLRKVEQTV